MGVFDKVAKAAKTAAGAVGKKVKSAAQSVKKTAKAAVNKAKSAVSSLAKSAKKNVQKVAKAIGKAAKAVATKVKSTAKKVVKKVKEKVKQVKEKIKKGIKKGKKILEDLKNTAKRFKDSVVRGITKTGAKLKNAAKDAIKKGTEYIKNNAVELIDRGIASIIVGPFGYENYKWAREKLGEGYDFSKQWLSDRATDVGNYVKDKNIPFYSDYISELTGTRDLNKKPSIGSITGAFVKGVVVDCIGGSIDGLVTMARHPAETLVSIGSAVVNWKTVLPAVAQGVKDGVTHLIDPKTRLEDKVRFAGQATGEIVSWIIGVGEAKAATTAAKTVETLEAVSDFAKVANNLADVGTVADKILDTTNAIGKVSKYAKYQQVGKQLADNVMSLAKNNVDNFKIGMEAVKNLEVRPMLQSLSPIALPSGKTLNKAKDMFSKTLSGKFDLEMPFSGKKGLVELAENSVNNKALNSGNAAPKGHATEMDKIKDMGLSGSHGKTDVRAPEVGKSNVVEFPMDTAKRRESVAGSASNGKADVVSMEDLRRGVKEINKQESLPKEMPLKMASGDSFRPQEVREVLSDWQKTMDDGIIRMSDSSRGNHPTGVHQGPTVDAPVNKPVTQTGGSNVGFDGAKGAEKSSDIPKNKDNKVELFKQEISDVIGGITKEGASPALDYRPFAIDDPSPVTIKYSEEYLKMTRSGDVEPHEWGLLFDPDGNSISPLITDNKTGSINISDYRNTSKNAIYTHNHPSGGPFSWQDLETARAFDMAEIRATLPDGVTLSIRRGSDGWNWDMMDTQRLFRQAQINVKNKPIFSELIATRNIPALNIELMNEIAEMMGGVFNAYKQ